MSKDYSDIPVVGLGQACLDYLGGLNRVPEEDEKIELADIRIQCGGPASTALVTLSRLGVKTAFLGSISDDHFGKEILAGLGNEKVDTSFLKLTPGYTSQFAFIAVTHGSGNRTIFWHRGSVPPLQSGDVDLSPFSNLAFLHLDGLMVEASIEAALQARQRGVKVVLDAGTMRDGSLELAAIVDVLIASERFADPAVGPDSPPEKTLEFLHSLGPGEVVVTLGSRGSAGYKNGRIVSQKAFPVEAVDTTGAGDVYHGAYIYGLLQGWGMPECMRFASAVAAMKCRKAGARDGIPGLEAVSLFMESCGV